MARFGGPFTTGRWGAEGLTRLVGKLLSGSGVLASGDLLVTAQTTPDMTVKVAAGDTAVLDGAIVRHGWSTASENVNIASNATGVTKTDVIVAYLDSAAASTTENNPNALVFASVRKPTGTGVPSGAEIIGVIGSKPYTILAEVTVTNGVGSINSGNIVDRRGVVSIPRSITGNVSGLRFVTVSGTPGYNGLAAGASSNETITFPGITTVVFASLVFQRGSGGSGETRITWSSDTQFSAGGNVIKFNVYNNGAAPAFISNVTYVAIGT